MEQETGGGKARKKGHGLVSMIVFILAYFAARGFLEMGGVPDAARVVAALVPVSPFAWMLWEIVRGIRAMDELEQRIQLEALALAFPLALILLMTLGLLEIAVSLPPEDLSYRHVWAMLPAFYFLGLTLARKRYG
jgi:hypothetical protein